jgi:hypothetical protein
MQIRLAGSWHTLHEVAPWPLSQAAPKHIRHRLEARTGPRWWKLRAARS